MITWTEADEKGIEGLQMLVDNGRSLMVPKEGKCSLEFEVVDYLKANAFIMDIFSAHDTEESKKMEEITGIRVTSVTPFSKELQKNEIRELLIQAIEKLS